MRIVKSKPRTKALLMPRRAAWSKNFIKGSVVIGEKMEVWDS